jgi:serine/threonine protein phosphatase PrpC
MKFSIYQSSHIGGRKFNQDRAGYAYTNDALLMVLADGMGGHLHGEVAAQLAVNTFMQAFVRTANPSITEPGSFLTNSMQSAHDAIIDYAGSQRLGGNPGTTCVAAVLQDGLLYWAHAGDSRLYLIRHGHVAAVTHDHSIVQLWADHGIISQDEIRTHPERNKITNCLGGVGRMFYADPVRAIPMRSSSDVLLLCSDGLWGPLSDEQLAAGIDPNNLPESMETLMDKALIQAGGGADNTTAVVMHWGGIVDEERDTPTAVCKVLEMNEENSLSEILGRTSIGMRGLGPVE